MPRCKLETFDRVVSQSFASWVNELKMTLRQAAPGIYEIVGSGFIVRIRLESGHGQSILVTLMKAKDRPSDISDASEEIGLGVVARFNGLEFHTEQIASPRELAVQANYLSQMASKLLAPYLLGLRDDFEFLLEFVQTLIGQSGIQCKKWTFPKNVREEWT